MINTIRTILIILLVIASQSLAQQYTKYVTVNGAGDHSGQNLANAMTLDEARGSAQPGDHIFVQKGAYPIAGKNFSVNGTLENPIIWEGEIDAVDYAYTTNTVNGTNSTLFFNATSSSNPAFSMSGAYNTFRKIIFEQDVDQKQLISVSGQGVTLDSCATKYPSNAGSSSNHTIVVTGRYVTFKYTTFRQGSRTIIWVRKNSGTQADYFTAEYCTFTNATNHTAIQIMPATNSTDTTTIKRPIVRNCLFIDNPYRSLYTRYCEQFAYYNNILINSASPFEIDIHTGFHYPTGAPEDTCNSKGGIIAYNTIIEDGGFNIMFNKGINQINFLNNLVVSTYSTPDMIFRFDGDWNAINRHNFDFNLYKFEETLASGNTVRGTWGSGNTTVWYNTWNSVTGHELNTIFDTEPTFRNSANLDYSPLNSSSPQVGKGTPITTANGYWMDVTTDFFGNPRDPNNPTIGAIEYNTGVGDIFPPNLLGAVINNVTTVTLNFSESLSSSTAQNINNYSINNGISVSAASVSGSQVVLTTSEHTAGSYTITVNNVTDLAGNVINPNSNTANYNYTPADITPPDLLTAVINNATSLTLSFSEPLTSGTAQNINNYSVNNGISVTAASLSGSQVTLTTSAHSSGNYTVTVNNATDLAGNVINPNNNSANYSYNEVDVTPPQVVSAAIVDSVKLNVYFSENLDPNSAQNINNYNIAGISITNAVLSANVVTLSTSVHTPATYSVVVNNVVDLSGNVIDPQHNSAVYEYTFDNVPPDVSNLSVTNTKSISVNFSEKLDPVKAKNKNNYSISNNILINSVQLAPDSMGVIIKTSAQQTEIDYTLLITNITDQAGNSISPNPKSVPYRIPKKGKGKSIQTTVQKAISNSWDGDYLPENTIDGEGMNNPESRWMSDVTMPDTISYDLGNMCSLDSLNISFYKWESGRQYKYSIYSSKDSLNWEPIISNIWSESLEWTAIEFDSTQARFVKLVLLESNQSPKAGIWEIEMFGPAEINSTGDNSEVPGTFSLSQNYPNPFNPSTQISYNVSVKTDVNLKIFDLLGSEIVELVNGEIEPGQYSVEFNAINLPSGVYFYRLQAGSFLETKKMILLK